MNSGRHAALAAPADAAAWQVRLLGGFALDDGRQRLNRLQSRAAMLLVARLALEPARDHAREELAALLWPDADRDAGRNRLRQTLSLLKAVLEPPGGAPVIVADRRVLRAVPGALWCDARAFEQALRAGQFELALGLYTGELLPGFYDEWVDEERLRLAALADRAAGRVGAGAGVGAEAASLATAPGRAPAAPAGPRPGPASTPPRPADSAVGPSATAPAAAFAQGQRLPSYLTRLVGAEAQAEALRRAVCDHRLVAVIGAGGSGKTRLAVEAARGLAEAAPAAPPGEPPGRPVPPPFERALFVSLVGAVTAIELLDRLTLALRLPASPDPLLAIAEALDGRAVLMLLDNAEQLDEAAAAAIAGLAERLPQAHWLITSRRPLQLDGERDVPHGSLDLPEPGAALAELLRNPAVALFVDRARAHRPEFQVREPQREAMAQLVRWLEGLPLAIELAAAQVRTLGPVELLALLKAAREQPQRDAGSLGLLARRGSRSGHDPRHASMLAVVDWSWRLLGAQEQRLMRALALLPSGGTLHTAAVLGAADEGPAGRLGPGAAQALLDGLAAQSMLRPFSGQDGQWRYTPAEPVREYVLATHDPAALRPERARVLRWLLGWAAALPATPPLPQVRDELPNLMAALAAAPADGAANDGLQLVLLLQSSWGEIAVPAGLLDTLDQLLAAPGLDDSRAAGGHAMAAWCCQEAGRAEDVRRHRAAALARPCPDPALRSMVLSRMARMYWRVDKDAARARELIEQALPLAHAAARPNTVASLLSLQGHLFTMVERDAQRGRELSAQAAAIWAASGNRHLINAGRYNVAVQSMEAGRRPADWEAVLPEFEALAAEGQELQDWDLAAGSFEARGTALLRLRRWAESAQSQRRALRIAWEGLELQAALYALWNLPPALARLRQAELAVETMGCVEAQWQLRYGRFDDRDRRDLKRIRRFARVLLGPEAAAAARARGAARPLGDAVRRALQGEP